MRGNDGKNCLELVRDHEATLRPRGSNSNHRDYKPDFN